MGQEPEQPEPVVDGHHHDVALAGQHAAPVEAARPRPRDERAAVDPDHHRPPAAVEARGPDVEAQAVLRLLLGRRPRGTCSSRPGDCGAMGPNRSHSRTPVHGSGAAGGRQRAAPAGEAA